MKPINILHIEDDEDDVLLVKLVLNKAGISFTQNVVSSKQSLLEALEEGLPDIVLSDHSLPAFNSLEALGIVKQKNINLPFILVTGNTSEEFAVSVIKAGADDYILKDRMQRLPSALLKALENSQLILFRNKIQREATQKIQESEVKYRSFFENSMDGMLLTVTDGEILMANPAACDLLQMTEEEICTAGRFGISDHSDPNLFKLIKERQLTGKARGEITLIRKDGSRFPAEISSVVYNDSNGLERTSMIFRDITWRKEIEQQQIATSIALRESLNVHEKIMQSSLDVICSFDEEVKFVNVSAACKEIWGYEPDELIGRSYEPMLFKEDVEKSLTTEAEIRSGRSVTVFENRFIHKNGSIISMLWSSKWDEKEKLFFSIGKNVTQLKKLEKANEIERQRFNDLYLQAPSCMGIIKGPDYVYEIANPLYLQLINKTYIIGKTVKEVLPELVSQGIFEFLDAVYKTGETFSANEMLVKFDFYGTGELVDKYLNFIYQAHRNADGEIDGIFFFAIDVTEQVLARQTIEASEKKFRQIVETAQEGIWMIDENSKTIFVNKKMCEILEYTEQEMMGKDIYAFMDAEAKLLAIESMAKKMKGHVAQEHFRYISKSGKEVWTNISANPLFNEEGTYKGALAMITDITEKKELQQQLLNEQINTLKQITRATLEAQEKERNYLGGELHDNISQILAAVKLQLTHFFEHPDAGLKLIKSARENVELAMKEIRELSHQLVTHRFGEELFIPMVNNLVLQLFPPGMVTISVSYFDESIPNEIKLTLYRIIQEHLYNIIKHAAANNIIISISNDCTFISILIEDDGIGFDLNQNRKGIGITNIYNRAESYNGKVEIASEPGKGCKLKVDLPF